MNLTDDRIEVLWEENCPERCDVSHDVVAFARAILKEAEAEELERDARRYRRLRDLNWHDDKLCCVMNPKNSVKIGTYCPSKEQLDDIIDSLC